MKMFWVSPIPNQRMPNGIQASGGIGRRISISGSTMSSTAFPPPDGDPQGDRQGRGDEKSDENSLHALQNMDKQFSISD